MHCVVGRGEERLGKARIILPDRLFRLTRSGTARRETARPRHGLAGRGVVARGEASFGRARPGFIP